MNKLISMNLGVRLVIRNEQGEHEFEWSAICPSQSAPHPEEALQQLCNLFNETFGTEMFVDSATFDTVSLAKPVKIKAPKKISHRTFNKRIKELGYD